jgi:tetraacyldisaccharide 4'-kinase
MKIIKALLLYPISLIYRVAVNIRNALFDLKILKSTEFDIPVISVGNITVGGTGKTPVTEYLVNLLRHKFKVAVLSRGYKRKTKGFLIADENSSVETIGDEPLQIKLKYPDITVAVSEKRVKGIKKLLDSKKETELIILDDAFQHRYVKPGLSILLVDFTQPFIHDHYLPYGRLRESPHQRYRAEIILVTKAPEDITPIDMRIMATDLTLKPYQTLYFSRIDYKGLMPVFENQLFSIDETTLKRKNYSMLLVTGIGNPKPIEQYCTKLTDDIRILKFPDHHKYDDKDLKKILKEFEKIENENKIIITTEKDALRIRCIPSIKNDQKDLFYFYPIEMKILNQEQSELNKHILSFVKKGRGQVKFLTSMRQY